MKGFYYNRYKVVFEDENVSEIISKSDSDYLHYGEIPETEVQVYEGKEGLERFIKECPCCGIWSYTTHSGKTVYRRSFNGWSKRIDPNKRLKITVTYYAVIVETVVLHNMKYMRAEEYADWCRDMQAKPVEQELL